jgi:metal-sulfur cluster biosynthetic enzyme
MDSNEITQKLWEEIATVEDPELHMSIRDLGLIYEVLAFITNF